MGGEDGGDIDMALATEGNRETGLPLMEVCDDGRGKLAGYVLDGGKRIGETGVAESKRSTHITEEPCNEVAKDDGVVGFVVIRRAGNASQVP